MKRAQIVVYGQTAAEVRAGGFSDEERFAAELTHHLGFTVPIVDDAQNAVSPDAAILLFAREPSAWMFTLEEPQRTLILRHLFLLEGQRAPNLLADLETHRLAGALEGMLYQQWCADPETCTTYGVFGLRTVVQRLGGECARGPFANERYCVFNNPHASSLIDSLARYLLELDPDVDY